MTLHHRPLAVEVRPRAWIARGLILAALTSCSLAMAQASSWPSADLPIGVTVVVEVRLVSNAEPADALVALNDMRAMMKAQPGYVSEVFLQNLNPANAPRYVHVSQWVSMAHWAALFRAPAFAELNAHGQAHYAISASAFVPAE
jgi:heme-degrading monooxygenase HmoA